ncbi:MAG TPA: Crp/Fnr family transcriptional regulator [Candidatus Angelobacter sp.]|nr:Crp/Fnr family transcriptional regulator [Candidatus Angelobacter sp.]
MAIVGKKPNILKVSARLKKTLMGAGKLETYPAQHCVFRLDQEASGVYLVVKGKVRLSLPDLPKLDRVFSPGSLLGLPATFTGHTYSLEAITATEAELLYVERQAFLDLMAGQPEFCREAADILSREVSFIQGALAERRRTKPTAA